MTRRILVVDDDRQMVRTLCDILRLEGWHADGVHSGEEAVEQVRREPYVAVLMDVRMGGMNGVDTMKALRQIRSGLHVVLMTAYTAAELLAEAEREGVLRVLAKPVALPALLEMLEETVEGARRVLVVDDDAQFLATICMILRSHGYSALEASSLEAAIKQIEEGVPAAVVLDLKLGTNIAPRESVLAIKRVSPAVVLILCSGHDGMIDDTVAAVPGSWIFASLRKPFAPDRLVSLLDGIVGG